jgi:tetratricopeptide (TPR) repeat protein
MIILLGMHRSGTSAVAGMLHAAGIVMGEQFMSPMPENPKGFFEDLRIQGINKQILQSIERDWKDLPEDAELERVPESVLEAIPQAWSYFKSRFDKWGWKDPRLCITFPLWARCLPLQELKILFVVRHPLSVARSLQTRNGMPLEKGFALWREYNDRIAGILRRYALPYTFLRYERIIEDPKRQQMILESRLDVSMGNAWEFIDAKLNRSDLENSEVPVDIREFYAKLLADWDHDVLGTATGDDAIESVLTRGEQCFASGDIGTARQCFSAIISLKPDHPVALNNLGVLSFSERNLNDAAHFFRRAHAAAPDSAKAVENMAECMKARGEFEEAAVFYRKAVNLCGPIPSLLNSLGICLTRSGHFEAAYRVFRLSLEMAPDQAGLESILKKIEALAVEGTGAFGSRTAVAAEDTENTPDANSSPGALRFRIVSYSDFEKDEERRLRWGDHWVKYELRKALEIRGHIVADRDPDIVIHMFGVPVTNLPRATHRIVWIHSHPDLVTPDILKDYDRIYCISPGFTEKIRRWGFAADLLVGGTAKKPLKRDPVHDIVFVANAKNLPMGRRIVADLMQTRHASKLAVWGQGWSGILPPENHKALYYDNQQLGELYATSRVVLNDHHDDMRREGFINPRILDVMASGGVVVSDDVRGVDSLFQDDLIVYRSPQELEVLLDRYLNDPQQREKAAAAGVRRVQSYTFEKMVERILSDIPRDLLAKRGTAEVSVGTSVHAAGGRPATGGGRPLRSAHRI